MNEQIVTVAGQTWVVPGNKVSSLIAWLNSNTVSAQSTTTVREIAGESNDPRQLLTEQA